MFFSTRKFVSRVCRGMTAVAGWPFAVSISMDGFGAILLERAHCQGANHLGDRFCEVSSGSMICFPDVVAVRTIRPSCMTMNDDSRLANGKGGVEKADVTPHSEAGSLAWNQMTPCGLWRFKSSSVSNAANCSVVTLSRK